MYKIGDRVKITWGKMIGQTGTIKRVRAFGKICVKLDEPQRNGHGDYYNHWWVQNTRVEYVTKPCFLGRNNDRAV